MLQASVLVKHPANPSPFHAVSFRKRGNLFLQDLQKAHHLLEHVLPFIFSNSRRLKGRLRHQRGFRSKCSFSILCSYSSTVLVIGSICISPRKSLTSVVFSENQQEVLSRGGDFKAATCHWNSCSPRNQTLGPYTWSSKRGYCFRWQFRSAESDEAPSGMKLLSQTSTKSKLVEDVCEGC